MGESSTVTIRGYCKGSTSLSTDKLNYSGMLDSTQVLKVHKYRFKI